jgi:hypothetical protein
VISGQWPSSGQQSAFSDQPRPFLAEEGVEKGVAGLETLPFGGDVNSPLRAQNLAFRTL